MIERQEKGTLRLRCDGDYCERLFSPARPFVEARPLRDRAALYGWHVKETTEDRQQALPIPGTAPPTLLDLCPECGREPR